MLRRCLMVLGFLWCAACGKSPLPVDEKVLCDRSSSDSCDERDSRAAGTAFIEANHMPGSVFTLYVVGCDVGDVREWHVIEVPAFGKSPARRKKEWRRAEEERLKSLTLPPINNCSAIAAGIWQVGRSFPERPGFLHRLIVISDLREVFAPLHLNFERHILAPQAFVALLRKNDLLPDLTGVAVSVCRVHNRRTPDAPRWTAEKSRQRDEAWSAVFNAMGVHGVRLDEFCSFGERQPAAVAVE